MKQRTHETVAGKLLRTDKRFSHLKQRQKEDINLWLYEAYRSHWMKTGGEPPKESKSNIIYEVMERIEAAEIWIPEQEITKYFSSQKSHYRKRIEKELQLKNQQIT